MAERNARRPSNLATTLWILGFLLVGFSIYVAATWHGWMNNIQDFLLILASITAGITAIGLARLIDKLTLRTKTE